MKVQDILNEEKSVLPDFITALDGKRLSWQQLNDYLKEQTEYLEPTGEAGICYRVKKDKGLTAARLIAALKRVVDDTVSLRKGLPSEVVVDFNSNIPVKAKVLFDQTDDIEQAKQNALACYAMSKSQGGKGWYMDNGLGLLPQYRIFGVFDDGPKKGEPFSVDVSSNAKASFKKDQIIYVTFETTYGKVKLVNKV